MKSRWIFAPVALAFVVVATSAQTPVSVPDNKYTPAEDVELGREAAEEARKQLPIMNDREVTAYLDRVGRRLVSAIPEHLRQPAFNYTFQAVNVRDINAFALPGGPMFINRGLMQASKTEGEVASVMAHELSHVVLRHGTAQASKATKYQIGQVAGAIVGAIIGGRAGSVVAQGTQFGLGTAFLRFGRDYERQADMAGAQIMARAGYDPREMAAMFRTLESKGSSGAPEWMSSHPNPGNRADAILAEAANLEVSNPVSGTAAFNQLKSHLNSLPRAPTTEEAIKNPTQATSSRGTTGPRSAGGAEAPSTSYTQYNEGDIFTVRVPSNWREMTSATVVTFAPEGGYEGDGQTAFSHGVQFGIGRNETHNLRTATEELIESIAQSNPGFGRASGFRNVTVSGRRGLQTTIVNVIEATKERETIRVVTTQLPDGNLFFMIAVAPEGEIRVYQPVFDRVVQSITLAD